ncbi:MAG: hypothetical protein HW420_1127 [Candidatus Nitrosotenuis sp.]|jgi:hypothetical protein|nr:hypothetical protein [Candidatus Nitrosotenuis sp.]
MSEPGKIEKGRAKNMNLYQSPRKAETGCVQTDYRRNCGDSRLREIKSSVKEAGRGYQTCPVVHTKKDGKK